MRPVTGPPTTSRQPDGAADVVFLDPGVPHAHAAEVQRVLQSCGGALTRILSKNVSAVLYHTPRPTGRALPGPKGFNSQRLLSGGAKAEGTAVPGAVLWARGHGIRAYETVEWLQGRAPRKPPGSVGVVAEPSLARVRADRHDFVWVGSANQSLQPFWGQFPAGLPSVAGPAEGPAASTSSSVDLVACLDSAARASGCSRSGSSTAVPGSSTSTAAAVRHALNRGSGVALAFAPLTRPQPAVPHNGLRNLQVQKERPILKRPRPGHDTVATSLSKPGPPADACPAAPQPRASLMHHQPVIGDRKRQRGTADVPRARYCECCRMRFATDDHFVSEPHRKHWADPRNTGPLDALFARICAEVPPGPMELLEGSLAVPGGPQAGSSPRRRLKPKALFESPGPQHSPRHNSTPSRAGRKAIVKPPPQCGPTPRPEGALDGGAGCDSGCRPVPEPQRNVSHSPSPHPTAHPPHNPSPHPTAYPPHSPSPHPTAHPPHNPSPHSTAYPPHSPSPHPTAHPPHNPSPNGRSGSSPQRQHTDPEPSNVVWALFQSPSPGHPDPGPRPIDMCHAGQPQRPAAAAQPSSREPPSAAAQQREGSGLREEGSVEAAGERGPAGPEGGGAVPLDTAAPRPFTASPSPAPKRQRRRLGGRPPRPSAPVSSGARGPGSVAPKAPHHPEGPAPHDPSSPLPLVTFPVGRRGHRRLLSLPSALPGSQDLLRDMSPGRALHVCSASLISSPDLLAPSSSPQPPSARGPPSARDATPCPPPPLPDHGPAASGARGDDSVDSECALYSTSTARPSPSPRGSGGASPAGSIDASTLSCTPRVIPEPRPRSSIGGQDEDSDGGIPPRTAVSTWKGLQLRKRRR